MVRWLQCVWCWHTRHNKEQNTLQRSSNVTSAVQKSPCDAREVRNHLGRVVDLFKRSKMSFNFGDSSKVTGFSLPVAPTTTTLTTTSTTTVASVITTSATASAISSPFSLGGGDPGAAVKPAQPQLSFAFGASPKLSLVATTSTPTVSTTSATATTATSAPAFGLGSALAFSQPIASTTSTVSLTSTPSLAAATSAQTTLGTSTVVTSSSSASTSSLNFCQLEEAINKWTLELEEQEKLFMNQASQVNTWDRLLIGNGEKIINLNNAVEQVKLEQQQLDQELDFILAQQRELEDLLTPLEKELETNGVSDPEREHTYQLAENLDTHLKQMSEDLKEIVEHINETNRSQDNTDPIVQIGRILNAHMNSLQWIDQNTTLIGSHLDQVAKLHEVHRRENERSFRLTYD